MSFGSRGRAATFGTALLCATLPISGCICQNGAVVDTTAPEQGELPFFEFVSTAERPVLTLWPVEPAAPTRMKSQLATHKENDTLVATTEGPDPYLSWEFEKPLTARVFTIELSSTKAARLQVFWATAACKVFDERCSATEQVVAGRQRVSFVVAAGVPLRALRLDLPEEQGVTIVLYGVQLYARPRLASGYHPREGHTVVAPTGEGLGISCDRPDPWVTFSTPWLESADVESVEADLVAPENAKPQLYFSGATCAEFTEDCQVRLRRVAGKPDAFVARLAGVPRWTGRITGLRFDPDEGPGRFVLKRLLFTRKTGKP